MKKDNGRRPDRCNVCGEPLCPESAFWCARHYIKFRVAGNAALNATPDGLRAHGGRRAARPEQPPEPTPQRDLIRRKLRPFGDNSDG
jgi:hypothetical protein